MMKILYALPATGNGHMSRALSLYPYLSKFGNIDFLISGNNGQLNFPHPIRYRCNFLSLQYNSKGGINYYKTMSDFQMNELRVHLRNIDIKNYDLVISDFEPLSAIVAKKNRKAFLHWGHQAAFNFEEVPRANSFFNLGRIVLENLVRSDFTLGLHFKSFNTFITEPIIKEEIYYSDRSAKDVITVYLPQYSLQTILNYLAPIKGVAYHIFHPEINTITNSKNIHYYPINSMHFNHSLKLCKLLITGAGFESPSEAMFLNKRLICIPIKQHYEQKSNAVVLDKLGVIVLNCIRELTRELIIKEFNNYDMAEYNLIGISPEDACSFAINYWEEHMRCPSDDIVEDFTFV